MARCYVCNRRVHFYQKQVRSNDGVFVAHKECLPKGFHSGEDVLALKYKEVK